MKKILVSACFMGANVRYDGVAKTNVHPVIQQWKKEGRLVTVCPEVSGGLSTPRPPAEIQVSTGQVITAEGDDVSGAFERGARHALHLCQKHQVEYALLKEFSPSCGGTHIYNGEFKAKKVEGQGITAKLLIEHNIKVYSELTIAQLIKEIESVSV